MCILTRGTVGSHCLSRQLLVNQPNINVAKMRSAIEGEVVTVSLEVEPDLWIICRRAFAADKSAESDKTTSPILRSLTKVGSAVESQVVAVGFKVIADTFAFA